MQTIAVVQARTSSSRLPGKVMMPILGTPMIIHQLWRVQRSKLIDKIILATSDNVSDDQLALLCERAGFNVFRGSLNNVLDRFQKAIAKEDYANIVRITGDCPLCDPKIIDDVDIFLVPGVGFDKKGTRLGKGSGIYDKLLSNYLNSTFIGVTDKNHLVEHIPYEDHDIQMHGLLMHDEFIDINL